MWRKIWESALSYRGVQYINHAEDFCVPYNYQIYIKLSKIPIFQCTWGVYQQDEYKPNNVYIASLITDCTLNIIITSFATALIFAAWYSLRCSNLKISPTFRVIYPNLTGDILVREKPFYPIKNLNWIWVNAVFCKWYLLERVDINSSPHIKLRFGMFKGFIDVNVSWRSHESLL